MNNDFFDFESLKESYDIEVKKASGKDRKGALPRDVWETYSAMANTEGGYIFLGGTEKKQRIQWEGIQDPDKVITEFWNNLNNSEKVSINLLINKDVRVVKFSNVSIVVIHVPRANRKQKPVYIGANPLNGTYRRNHEGDYRCSPDLVKQMLGEQLNDSRDNLMLENTGLLDIDSETLKIYRQNFANRKPNHPFNNEQDLSFLRQIGGWTIERSSGKGGLTLAGLLMFGRLRSILDFVPNYIVDYQERPRSVTEWRWIDRVTTDFTWSGNLYSFYRIVIQKLTSDLKIPFILKDDQRVDDTLVHEALREAFVNTLIHADYFGNCSILVVKRPDLFGLRNPGLLRIPREDIFRGGVSDCRNRNLQKMFQLIGLGEQAGSGFLKIYKNWKAQHWRTPELEERIESNQTVLALRMSSLLPDTMVKSLQESMGTDFEQLNALERLALVTAKAEGCVTHRRLSDLSTEHSNDLTRTLHKLLDKGFLKSEGAGKATFYFIPGEHPIQGDIFSYSDHNDLNSDHNDLNSDHNDSNSDHNDSNSDHNLNMIAQDIASQKRAKPEIIKQTIINLCQKQELSMTELASLLNRAEVTIRTRYVHPLCEDGRLKRKYPNIINHPQQKYYAEEE